MGRAINTPYAVLSLAAHTITNVYDVTASPARYEHDRLVVRGAREHNLRHISVDLPRDSLIVFTGLSGSGKSSLAFDTIFAEGQRRYVESLSAYARQFLGRMDKPDVDFIEGLSPAVSIDQKATNRNPRSTVGTITEVYDYLRLLFARAGTQFCPVCGEQVSRQTPQQIVDRLLELPDGTRYQVLAPVVRGRKGEYADLFRELQAKGFARARVDGEVVQLTDAPSLEKKLKHTVEVVIDRLVAREGVQRQSGLHRVGEPALHALAGHQAVDHHLHCVLELLLQARSVGELDHLAVDPGSREALGLQLTEEIGVLALAAPDHGRQHLVPGAVGQLEQPVDDLLRRLTAHLLPAHRAELGPGAGEEQPEVVIDLGDGPDGRPRVAVGGLLVDRHRRRQAFDEVDVRLVHPTEELARVGGQRLDVAPLPLGEDRVERQRRLAGARQAGEDDQAVPRQVEVDVAQVVLARAPDPQSVIHPDMVGAHTDIVHLYWVSA